MSNPNQIIEDLIAEGALVLYHDYRSGMAYDWSGQGNSGTLTDVYFTGSGIRTPANSSRVDIADSAELQLTEGTIVFLVEGFGVTGSFERLISKRDAGGLNYEILLNGADLYMIHVGGDLSHYATFPDDSKYCAIDFGDGTTSEGWSNGVSIGNLAGGTLSFSKDDAPMRIANVYSGSDQFTNTINAALVVNRKLTATEHALLYDALSNMSWDNSVTNISVPDLNIHPNKSNLVVSYNMSPVTGKLIDRSPSGNDGVVSGGVIFEHTSLGEGILTDGSTNRIDMTGFTSTSQDYTFVMWVKSTQLGTSKYLFQSQTDSFVIAWNNTVSGKIGFYDGIWKSYIDAPNDGLWHHLVFVFDSSQSKSTLYIDSEAVVFEPNYTSKNIGGTVYLTDSSTGSSRQFEGEMVGFEVYEEVVTQEWITQRYQEGRAALWQTAAGAHESDGAVSSGFLENTPFIVNSGSFKSSQATVSGFPGLAIECVTAGVIYLPTNYFQQTLTEAAYGTWEWWQYKVDAGEIAISFGSNITPTTLGNWRVQSDSAEVLKLIESGVNTWITSATPLVHSTWETIKLTRDSDSNFELFQNGSSVGTVTDTSVTSAQYFSMSMTAGDKVFFSDTDGIIGITKRLFA